MVPVLTEKKGRLGQSRHRCVIRGCFTLHWIFVEPQCGQLGVPSQMISSNQLHAVSSLENISKSCFTLSVFLPIGPALFFVVHCPQLLICTFPHFPGPLILGIRYG